MIKTYYHATSFENLDSILDKGIQTGCDDVVYLCKRPEEAIKFVAIRGCSKILVIEVQLEEDMIEESFDHSQVFFKCRAYMYPKDITPISFVSAKAYEI